MHRCLIELEYFRVLLKYFGDMACLKSRFGSRHPRSSGFPAPIFKLVPIRFHPRQAHSFLHLAIYLNAAHRTHSLFFPGDQQWHRAESASPLNPFIGTENRII
jgi:hypothetical protein